MDGRVKTLHPKSARRPARPRRHRRRRHARPGHRARSTCSSSISIPSLRRSRGPTAVTKRRSRTSTSAARRCSAPRAKNHERVTVLVDPADYAAVLAELRAGGVTEATRRRLAAKAFGHTAQYDAIVSGWLRRQQRDATSPNARLRRDFARGRTCATARIRTSPPRSTPIRSRRSRRSRRPGSCRARNFPSTTSRTRTLRSNACGSSTAPPA